MTDNSNAPKGITGKVVAIGGVAAAILSIIALWNVIFPPPPPPPPTHDATLSSVAVDSGTGGVTVNFTAEIEGYEGKECPVTYVLYNSSRSKVSDEIEALTLKPESNKDQGSAEIWVPHPGTPGTYYVRIRVYPPDYSGAALHYIDSPTFNFT
jgi:hypothetical protein